MDRHRFTIIAHGDHAFCSPVSPEGFDRLVALIGLAPEARVLDVGCGKGEALIRIAEHHDIVGLGVDSNAAFLEEAHAQAGARVPGRLEFRAAEIAAVPLAPASFDLAICIGSTHAYGGFRPTLRGLSALVRPGGHLLVGEGHWKIPPAPEYLALLGGTEDEFTGHNANALAAQEEGLEPLASLVSTPADWDDYEGRYAANVERHVAAHPDDPDAAAMLERIRRWNGGYLRWGRDTLGFALYLLRRP